MQKQASHKNYYQWEYEVFDETVAHQDIAKRQEVYFRKHRATEIMSDWRVGFAIVITVALIQLGIFIVLPAGITLETFFIIQSSVTIFLFLACSMTRDSIQSMLLRQIQEERFVAWRNDFLHRNRLVWQGSERNVHYPGVAFDRKGAVNIYDKLQSSDELFEVGTAQFTVGSGNHEQSKFFGYIRFQLAQEASRIPHFLLDSKNDKWLFSAWSLLVSGLERYELEGHFPKKFVLYVAPGRVADALYILTPDVMTLLIDIPDRLNIEIVGGALYVYIEESPSLRDVRSYSNLLSGADSILEILLPRIKKYLATKTREMDEWDILGA